MTNAEKISFEGKLMDAESLLWECVYSDAIPPELKEKVSCALTVLRLVMHDCLTEMKKEYLQ